MAEVSDMELIEIADYWDLPVEGSEVTRVSFDWAVSLLIGSPESTFEVRIEDGIRLDTPEHGSLTIDPEGDPQQLAAALVLLRQPVAYVRALKNGELNIGLDNGSTLRVSASDEYEPWEITEPRGTRIVSTPGGSLAIWRS
ncbi:DUF6188 family protein [Streptomyces guryensis]|uniref:DUF6188 family protein n=1 Tax=Streptomyces guryensis TaxID=2886947 RepID=A0A9Q3Z7B1_9ACTN|nr:DUF6188 family protein [Streptomyces guryensis]MCD9872100.1 DUF6188 family protein [Streptomyces guryensis]